MSILVARAMSNPDSVPSDINLPDDYLSLIMLLGHGLVTIHGSQIVSMETIRQRVLQSMLPVETGPAAQPVPTLPAGLGGFSWGTPPTSGESDGLNAVEHLWDWLSGRV